MEKNEFGWFSMQMRSPLKVKNATVFEVDRVFSPFLFPILEHGDLDQNDLNTLLSASREGREFWVFDEDPFSQSWRPAFLDNSDPDLGKMENHARNIFRNGDQTK